MNASELITRTYEALGNNFVFYTQAEVLRNGISPAQRLLVLLKPELLTRRVTIPLISGGLFYDLRTDQVRANGTVTATSDPPGPITAATGLVDLNTHFTNVGVFVGMRVRRVTNDAVGIITHIPSTNSLRFTGGLDPSSSFQVGDAYRVELQTSDAWRIERVLLGGIIAEDPVTSNDHFRPLTRTSLGSLRWRRNWYETRGTPRHWFLFGLYWLCIWPRPEQDEFLTLVYRALPTELSTSNLNAEPDFAETWHDVLPQIAAALLLAKEGSGEVEMAANLLSERLGREPFQKLMRAVRSSMHQQESVVGAA